MNKLTVAAISIFVSMTFVQAAETLPLTPGLWEIQGTTTNPFSGSRTYKSQECMSQLEFDPKEMMEGMPEDACEINTEVTGNTITYNMDCDMQGNQMIGNGSFTVNGDTANGEMTMQSSFSGQTVEMTMVSEAKRIGDC